MEFPIYRKYANGKHFFRIRSHELFDELYIMGSRYELREKHAEKHPDRILIQDMLEMRAEGYEKSSREEFEAALAECRAERTPL